MRTEVEVAAAGGIVVAFLYDARGYSEVGEFMNNLRVQHPNDHAKTMALFTFASQIWPIRNGEKCHKVEDEIWEFKSHQIRILWFWDPSHSNTAVCASAERKKRQDLAPGTIRRAKDRRTEWQVFLNNNR